MLANGAEEAGRWLLERIRSVRHLGIWMPHRFDIGAIHAEPDVNPFSPSLHDWYVTATAKVPVIWTAVNSFAAPPPDRDNLEALRELVKAHAPEAPARRLRLVDWDVTPDDFRVLPPREAPNPAWIVRVGFDVR